MVSALVCPALAARAASSWFSALGTRWVAEALSAEPPYPFPMPQPTLVSATHNEPGASFLPRSWGAVGIQELVVVLATASPSVPLSATGAGGFDHEPQEELNCRVSSNDSGPEQKTRPLCQ